MKREKKITMNKKQKPNSHNEKIKIARSMMTKEEAKIKFMGLFKTKEWMHRRRVRFAQSLMKMKIYRKK